MTAPDEEPPQEQTLPLTPGFGGRSEPPATDSSQQSQTVPLTPGHGAPVEDSGGDAQVHPESQTLPLSPHQLPFPEAPTRSDPGATTVAGPPTPSGAQTSPASDPSVTQVQSPSSSLTPGSGGWPAPGFTGELEPGMIVFDKYLVIRLLGQGGMGAVWLVRHRDLDVERALKVIVSGISTDKLARARLKREARVMARFSHPNAVAVHDARMTSEAAFIEMEFVRGKCLNALHEQGKPMPLDWTARILQQLCDVLQVAHDHGIVHRDLKPSNLMLLDGRPGGHEFLKVLDFGIAKLLSADRGDPDDVRTRTGLFMGTAPYASPDQLHGGDVDGRSDIYSVGIILYEFLTGSRPFTGATTLYDHLHTPPPLFSVKNPHVQVPHEVEQIVLRCLAKNPAERPQCPRALAEAFLQAAGPSASTSPMAPRTAAQTGTPLDASGHGTAFQTTERFTAGGLALPATEPIDGAVKPVRRPVARPLVIAGVVLVAAVGLAFALSRNRDVSSHGNDHAGPPPSAIASNARPAGPKGEAVFPPDGYTPDPAAGSVSSLSRALMRARPPARFILIEGGEFSMGSSAAPNSALTDEQPAHPVRLAPFYIQATEVTNDEMIAFFLDSNQGRAEWPEKFRAAYESLIMSRPESQARLHPAVGISHAMAQQFARWAQGRLPREAEWEFAARSRGKSMTYVWGDAPEPSARQANINTAGDDPTAPTKPVGSFRDDKTQQDIFDLTGNVREWCLDAWAPYPAGSSEALLDPINSSGPKRVIRGGSFLTDVEHGRTTFRSDQEADYHTASDLGFRIVIEPPRPEGKTPPSKNN